jgi:hypothetical protein
MRPARSARDRIPAMPRTMNRASDWTGGHLRTCPQPLRVQRTMTITRLGVEEFPRDSLCYMAKIGGQVDDKAAWMVRASQALADTGGG